MKQPGFKVVFLFVARVESEQGRYEESIYVYLHYIVLYAVFVKKYPNLLKGPNTSDLLIYLVILLTIPRVTSRIAKGSCQRVL